jgi:hypothetical protein
MKNIFSKFSSDTKSKYLHLFFVLIFLNTNSIFSDKLLSYNEIDSILKKTWDDTYPVQYKKILKKDIFKKGIFHILSNPKEYIYTFLLFIPNYELENTELIELETGKEIPVKLIYSPQNQEQMYRIELGELNEKNYSSKGYKWIR